MQLPSLNAVRAFEAAARHESFLRAADELHVSAGAISRQVKLLEDRLGVRLFERHSRGVSLTEAGRSYLADVSAALTRIAEATLRLTNREQEIRVFVAPTLAVRWLIPHLAEFVESHPGLRIGIGLNTKRFEDFIDGGYDAGLGQGPWIDMHSDMLDLAPLRYEQLAPVCAPAVAQRMMRRQPGAELDGECLLHAVDEKDWELWLAKQGRSRGSGSEQTLSTTESSVRAALAGRGVAIADLPLYRQELVDERLVAPFSDEVVEEFPIYFYTAKGRMNDPTIMLMRDWLAATLGSFRI